MHEYLKSFNTLSPQEIEELGKLAVAQTLAKNEYFIQEGRVCKSVAFVVSGIFRSFYYSSTGDEITYCFTFPGSFVTAYSSYISQQPTAENIQALTSVELLTIPAIEMKRLEERSMNFLKLSKSLAEQEYVALEKRIFLLQTEKAEKRYEDMLAHHPEYLQLIPLNYLASYLGITQRHLSRIRANLSN